MRLSWPKILIIAWLCALLVVGIWGYRAWRSREERRGEIASICHESFQAARAAGAGDWDLSKARFEDALEAFDASSHREDGEMKEALRVSVVVAANRDSKGFGGSTGVLYAIGRWCGEHGYGSTDF